MSKCEDPLVDCPLDKFHRIRTSRLQFHLVRCLKNHRLNKSRKVKCPYNPLHIVDAVEILHHCESCYDSASVLLDKYDLEGEKGYSGVISMEYVNAIYDAIVPEKLKWEMNNNNRPGYDPTANIESKPIFRQLIGESKSKRKTFRQQERRRIAALEAENKTIFEASVSEPVQLDKPLRKPHILPTNLTKSAIAEHDNTDKRISNVKEKQIAKANKPKTKIGMTADFENKENINSPAIKKQNDEVVNDETNIEKNSGKPYNDLNCSNDSMRDIVVDSVTDIMKQLQLVEKKKNVIKQHKMKLMELIPENNLLVQPTNSTISYQDNTVIKSNGNIRSDDKDLQSLSNKQIINPNMNNRKVKSIKNLRFPKSVNHPQIHN